MSHLALYLVTPKFLTWKQRGTYTNAEVTQPSDPAITFGEEGAGVWEGALRECPRC